MEKETKHSEDKKRINVRKKLRNVILIAQLVTNIFSKFHDIFSGHNVCIVLKNTAKRNTQGRATLLKQRTLMTALRRWNMSGPM